MLSYKCDACKLEIPSNDVCNVNLRKEDFNANKHLCPNCFDTIVKFMSAWDSNIKAPTATLTERKAMLEDAVEEAEIDPVTVAKVVTKKDEKKPAEVAPVTVAKAVPKKEETKQVPKKEEKKTATDGRGANCLLTAEDKEQIQKLYQSGITSAGAISKQLGLNYMSVYYHINKLKERHVLVKSEPVGSTLVKGRPATVVVAKEPVKPAVPKKPVVMHKPIKQPAPTKPISDEARQEVYATIAKKLEVSASNVGTVHSLSKAGWSPRSIAFDTFNGNTEVVKEILSELHKAGI